jgi:hypothetical protein
MFQNGVKPVSIIRYPSIRIVMARATLQGDLAREHNEPISTAGRHFASDTMTSLVSTLTIDIAA